jgi:hypothetical protein
MLYREMLAFCSGIHTKHINTLCGQNVEFVNVKPGGTYSSRWALRFKLLTQENLSLFLSSLCLPSHSVFYSIFITPFCLLDLILCLVCLCLSLPSFFISLFL